MAPESAAHTFFATPELASMLFSLVDRHALTQCTRVCKRWLQLAGPVLWAIFDIEAKGFHPFQPKTTLGLIKNRPHIRELSLSAFHCDLLWDFAYGLPPDPQPESVAIVPCTLCTNLRELALDIDAFSFPSPPLVALLRHNHRLTRLSLPFIDHHMDHRIDDAILEAISGLRFLEYLQIGSLGREVESSRTLSTVLQACLPLPNLTALYLDFEMDRIHEGKDTSLLDLETIIKKASVARFSQRTASKIKSLLLPTCHELSKDPLLFLLLKSDLLDLDYCMMPYFSQDTRPKDVEQTVREYCPGLNDLEYRQMHLERDDDHFMRAFIRGCSGLKRFSSDNFSDHVGNGFAAAEDPLGGSRRIIKELLANHCKTLQELELTNCTQVLSCDQQAVLSGCKQLREYYVLAAGEDTSAGFELADATKGSWVCMELTVLAMTLNRHPIQRVGNLDSEQIAVHAKRFYAQVGRLEKLEMLLLGIDEGDYTAAKESDYAWDLTLSRGWLGEMTRMKSLEKLVLDGDFWSKMGQAEVEFIHEHWPLLSEICLRGRLSSKQATLLRNQPHWRWLIEKRPHFRLEMK